MTPEQIAEAVLESATSANLPPMLDLSTEEN